MRDHIIKIGSFTSIIVLIGLSMIGCSPSTGPDISIENAWGSPSPKAAGVGAFYMLIRNNGNESDKLIAGSSPACGVVELHETFKRDDGVMGMRLVDENKLEIPADGQIELKTGGIHIMCIDKLIDFEFGSILPLTLEFEKSGQITLDVEIRQP